MVKKAFCLLAPGAINKEFTYYREAQRGELETLFMAVSNFNRMAY